LICFVTKIILAHNFSKIRTQGAS